MAFEIFSLFADTPSWP